ncbi:MAG: hypothetical protein RI995_1565 [Bacteroidota bacterium]
MKKIISLGLFFIAQAIMAQQPFFQGHRGCRGFLPENSLPAFEKALELGVVLEMDVCMSKDGQVVVSHEPYMNSLFCVHPDGRPVKKEEEKVLNLFQMNYSEIKRFDSGIKGNPNFPQQEPRSVYKPLLSEVLEMTEAYRRKTGKPVYYNIEIKSDSSEYGISQPKEIKIFADRVYQVIQHQVKWEFVTLQSFDFQALKFLQKEIQSGRYQKMSLSALVSRKSPQKVVEDLGFVPDIYSSAYTSLSKEWIDISHQLGMKVIPWTVNDEKEMERLKNLGVDGIITDYPTSVTGLPIISNP